jgi:hypothetical protein
LLRLVSDNPAPRLGPPLLERVPHGETPWPWGRFLMSPDQHRRQAALLRANPSPKAQELATHHEQLARAIEKRHPQRDARA